MTKQNSKTIMNRKYNTTPCITNYIHSVATISPNFLNLDGCRDRNETRSNPPFDQSPHPPWPEAWFTRERPTKEKKREKTKERKETHHPTEWLKSRVRVFFGVTAGQKIDKFNNNALLIKFSKRPWRLRVWRSPTEKGRKMHSHSIRLTNWQEVR